MVAAQVRMDRARFPYTQIKAIVDKGGRSLTSTMGKNTATTYATHRIAGTLLLTAGQTLALHLFVSEKKLVSIDAESGWGVVKVPDEDEGYVGKQAGAGFHPQKTGAFGPNWNHFNQEACSVRNVQNDCPHYGGFEHNTAGMNHGGGVYRVQEDGIYKLDATLRMENFGK